jgi:hypothetical protein
MDLEMVKQEQGETLRKYMRRFFDKCATVVAARAPSPTSRT